MLARPPWFSASAAIEMVPDTVSGRAAMTPGGNGAEPLISTSEENRLPMIPVPYCAPPW